MKNQGVAKTSKAMGFVQVLKYSNT